MVFLDVFMQEAPKVARFLEKHDHGLTVLLDPEGSAKDAFGFVLTPLVVVVGPDGTLRYRGGMATADELRPVVAAALEGASPPEPAPTPHSPE